MVLFIMSYRIFLYNFVIKKISKTVCVLSENEYVGPIRISKQFIRSR